MAESHYALLSTAAITLVVWYLSGLVSRQLYLPLALFGVSTYLMMELNNSNALIRIYSRMVSCSFMILACTALPLFQSLDTALVTLCFITFLLAAFNVACAVCHNVAVVLTLNLELGRIVLPAIVYAKMSVGIYLVIQMQYGVASLEGIYIAVRLCLLIIHEIVNNVARSQGIYIETECVTGVVSIARIKIMIGVNRSDSTVRFGDSDAPHGVASMVKKETCIAWN